MTDLWPALNRTAAESRPPKATLPRPGSHPFYAGPKHQPRSNFLGQDGHTLGRVFREAGSQQRIECQT